MNAYLVDAGVHDVYVEAIVDYPRYELARLVEVVIAPTGGKARTAFLSSPSMAGGHIEFADIKHVRKLSSDMEGPCRAIVEPREQMYDVLWEAAGRALDKIDGREEEDDGTLRP